MKRLKTTEYEAVRRSLGGAHGAPIEVIEGLALAPRVVGNSWHYETRGCRRINHPSAYSKVGWSNMVYCHSTRRLQVGRIWLDHVTGKEVA